MPSDLATPCDVFSRACLPNGEAAYEVVVCGERRRVRSASFDLYVPNGLRVLAGAHTVVVPGCVDPSIKVSRAVLLALQAAAASGSRLASVCTGAFTLAEAGLLDGLRATTHWLAAAELARRYPRVQVDANVLFVDNGQVLTSAGASAALDLCLHMVRSDFGASVAAETARMAVAPLIREGGQAQYAHRPTPTGGLLMQPMLDWIDSHLRERLTLAGLADEMSMSVRTFSRRFLEETGTTPMQWVAKRRIQEAQRLLEETTWSVDRIAEAAGFGSTPAFRVNFMQVVGTNPQRYRSLFR